MTSRVSEITIFRHFETKRGLLEAVILKYSHIQPLKAVFEERLSWDLEQDLKLMSRTYLEGMENNRSVSAIVIQERDSMPWLVDLSVQNVRQLQQLLADYFEEMQARGKMGPTNVDIQSIVVMMLNFGYYMGSHSPYNPFETIDSETFIEHSVNTLVRGLRS